MRKHQKQCATTKKFCNKYKENASSKCFYEAYSTIV